MQPDAPLVSYFIVSFLVCMYRSRGGGSQGVWTPLKNHKIIGFLRNTGPDPLKNGKATMPAFNVWPS